MIFPTCSPQESAEDIEQKWRKLSSEVKRETGKDFETLENEVIDRRAKRKINTCISSGSENESNWDED